MHLMTSAKIGISAKEMRQQLGLSDLNRFGVGPDQKG